MAQSSAEPPSGFVCPLTMDVMTDPVFTIDGQTYERSEIAEWLLRHDTSPCTGARLMRGRELDKSLTPNIALRKSIEEWRQAQGLAGGGTYSAKASRVDEEEKEEKEEVPVGTIVSPGSNTHQIPLGQPPVHSEAALAVPALSVPTIGAAGNQGQRDDAVGNNQHRPPRGSWHLPRRAASWNETDPYESLFEAARHGDDAELRRLLEDERLDPMEHDECDRTCLHLACKHGHSATFQYLIQREDAERMVKARDEDMWNCLHFVADLGDTSMVHSLLEVGGPGLLVQETKMGGWTPLDLARRKDSKSAMSKLLKELKKENEKKAGKGGSWLPGSWVGWGKKGGAAS